jgi:DNA polymerase-3 subunit delta
MQGVLGQLRSQKDKGQLTDLLDRLPSTTALVIVEETLKDTHWMMKWAQKAGERVFIRTIQLPKGAALAQWIRAQARERGGDFTPEGAGHLAGLVADDNRMASSEVDKLLAYVNYKRPVDVDDVELLTPSMQTGDVFQMVDAIGNRQGKLALKILHQLLGERDPLSLLGMITRQFRLLLQTKEMLDDNAAPNEIVRSLKIHDFVARKLTAQCRNFDLPLLEAIYRKLAEIDESIKTGKMDAETALDTLVAGLTS